MKRHSCQTSTGMAMMMPTYPAILMRVSSGAIGLPAMMIALCSALWSGLVRRVNIQG